MGSNKSALLSADDVEILSRETGFKPKELQRLYARFQELQSKEDTPTGYLTRVDLLNIREVAANPLGEHLIDVILQDYGDAVKINFRQFVHFLARFRRGKVLTHLNTKEEKFLFLFSLYDRNHDMKIDRHELEEILKLMLGGNIQPQEITTIADHAIEELDADGDLRITFEEFCRTLSKVHIDEKLSMKFLT